MELYKLHYYGIRGTALEWFKDYFKNRCQFVDINGFVSESLPSTLGVVQGSIPGPVFSNIYLNDMYKVLDKMTLFSFADDCLTLATLARANNTKK